MENFELGNKTKHSNKNAQAENASNSYIRPFKESPSKDNSRHENAGRINAHDLFSHYTADIIKEETVFAR